MLLGAGSASALDKVQQWSTSDRGADYGPLTSKADVCEAARAGWAATQNFSPGYGATVKVTAGGSNGLCEFYATATSGNPSYFDHSSELYSVLSCPANSSANSAGGCSCSSGYEEKDGMCKPPPNECEKLAGQSAGAKAFEGRGDSFFFCDAWNTAGGGKCVAKVEPSFRYEDPPGSGHWISQGTARYTGQSGGACNGNGGDGAVPAPSTPKTEDGQAPTTPDPGTAAPAPCPEGQSPGEVNGQRVCAPRGTDGKVEEKSTSSSTNAAGDKTDTTKETKCDGGQCTTTTTNCTTPNGQTSANCTSTSTTGSASGTCKAGSGLAMCGEGSTQTGFSGNCAAGFKAVSDDAVINAMAEEVYRQNCKINPDEASQALYKAAAAKYGTDQSGDLPGNRTVSLGPEKFDTSDALGTGGGACLPDKTVVVMNRSITIPFGGICPYLGYLGNVLLAVSFLLAARIVMRG